MIHLRSVRKAASFEDGEGFPFSIRVIQSLERIEFTRPVTIFVGENGSGKSTLLEAIACSVGSIAVGSESVGSDQTLGSIRALSRRLHLTWHKRTRKGFFLRAEDFFGYVKNLERMKIPINFDFTKVHGLSNELKKKLSSIRPNSLGQASRMVGITPAALSVLMIAIKAFNVRI